MNVSVVINLLYVVLVIIVYFLDDITKLRKMQSRRYKKRIQKYSEKMRAFDLEKYLKKELYWLGFRENTQLREYVTSIFVSEYEYGVYFRLGDDGSVSSRCTSINIDEIQKCVNKANDFISVWHNGHIIRSKTMNDCRILAQCDNIVLVGKKFYDFRFSFTIWRFDGKSFYGGREIEGDYCIAKQVFAGEILLETSEKDKENLSEASEPLYSVKPLTETHEIKDIIPPKWSVYVESSFFLL